MESGLKVKEATVINMNRQTHNQENIYKDYKVVDGIKFPSVRIGSMGPQMIETKLLEAAINVEVSEEDFN